jgi:hypothetical protein
MADHYRNRSGYDRPYTRGEEPRRGDAQPEYRRRGGHDFDDDFRAPDQADSYDRGLGFGGTEDMHGLSPAADDLRFRHQGGRSSGRMWGDSEDWEEPFGRSEEAGGDWTYESGRGSGIRSWSIPGPHSGRGPRGYQSGMLSNERIKSQVCERLSRHGMIDASDIEVRVEDSEVTLEGLVEDRRSKRLAEQVAESVESVLDVHNRLKIKK